MNPLEVKTCGTSIHTSFPAIIKMTSTNWIQSMYPALKELLKLNLFANGCNQLTPNELLELTALPSSFLHSASLQQKKPPA
jgi:hypothetical protein